MLTLAQLMGRRRQRAEGWRGGGQGCGGKGGDSRGGPGKASQLEREDTKPRAAFSLIMYHSHNVHRTQNLCCNTRSLCER